MIAALNGEIRFRKGRERKEGKGVDESRKDGMRQEGRRKGERREAGERMYGVPSAS